MIIGWWILWSLSRICLVHQNPSKCSYIGKFVIEASGLIQEDWLGKWASPKPQSRRWWTWGTSWLDFPSSGIQNPNVIHFSTIVINAHGPILVWFHLVIGLEFSLSWSQCLLDLAYPNNQNPIVSQANWKLCLVIHVQVLVLFH